MQSIIQAIEGSAANEWILSSAWLWPAAEVLHFIGLSLLIGSLIVIDLRLFGFLRQLELAVVHKLLKWTLLGFGINVVTGILFIIGDPARYAANIGFRIKMLLVVVAGLNAIWFFRHIDPLIPAWDPSRRHLGNGENHRFRLTRYLDRRPAAGPTHPLHRHRLTTLPKRSRISSLLSHFRVVDEMTALAGRVNLFAGCDESVKVSVLDRLTR